MSFGFFLFLSLLHALILLLLRRRALRWASISVSPSRKNGRRCWSRWESFLEESLSFQAESSRLRRSICSSKLVLSYIECFLFFSTCRCDITTLFCRYFRTVKRGKLVEEVRFFTFPSNCLFPARYNSPTPSVPPHSLHHGPSPSHFPVSPSSSLTLSHLSSSSRPRRTEWTRALQVRTTRSLPSRYKSSFSESRWGFGRGGEGVPASSMTEYGSEEVERTTADSRGRRARPQANGGPTLSRLTDLPTILPSSTCASHVLESHSLPTSSTSDLGRERGKLQRFRRLRLPLRRSLFLFHLFPCPYSLSFQLGLLPPLP